MHKLLLSLGAAAVALLAPSISVQTAAQPGAVVVPEKAAALLGIWMMGIPGEEEGPQGPRPAIDEETLPLTDYGRRRMEARREEIAVRNLSSSERNVKCWPPGMPQFMSYDSPIQIIPLPDRIVMIGETGRVPRTIFLNKTSLPEDYDPSWNGYSTGHWEGDTLVVQTSGFNDRDAFVFYWTPPVKRTPFLKVTERIRIDAEGHLENQMTLDDPKTFTRPYTLTYRYRKLEPDAELYESVCEVDPQKIILFDENKIVIPLP